jgi:hypothetical protein
MCPESSKANILTREEAIERVQPDKLLIAEITKKSNELKKKTEAGITEIDLAHISLKYQLCFAY